MINFRHAGVSIEDVHKVNMNVLYVYSFCTIQDLTYVIVIFRRLALEVY